jgi:hypothetical protein
MIIFFYERKNCLTYRSPVRFVYERGILFPPGDINMQKAVSPYEYILFERHYLKMQSTVAAWNVIRRSTDDSYRTLCTYSCGKITKNVRQKCSEPVSTHQSYFYVFIDLERAFVRGRLIGTHMQWCEYGRQTLAWWWCRIGRKFYNCYNRKCAENEHTTKVFENVIHLYISDASLIILYVINTNNSFDRVFTNTNKSWESLRCSGSRPVSKCSVYHIWWLKLNTYYFIINTCENYNQIYYYCYY